MIFEDIDGRVWISISNKGLTRFDPATGTITPMEYNPAKPALLPSLGVYSILRMSDNELQTLFQRAYRRFYLSPGRVIRTVLHHPRIFSLPRYALITLLKLRPFRSSVS
ncbi:MAG: hypothetical protein BWY39_00207 [Spirochaetes bacterium ADurb.Bin269]|nr:MAG: hypothetical protein BWY39_00207 [Spirochaetes bacterium ADurb.Bin269]